VLGASGGVEPIEARAGRGTTAAPSYGDDDRPFPPIRFGIDLKTKRRPKLGAQVAKRLVHPTDDSAAS
jgi:hypothetical protein